MKTKPFDKISPWIEIVRNLLNFDKKNTAIKKINFLQKQNCLS